MRKGKRSGVRGHLSSLVVVALALVVQIHADTVDGWDSRDIGDVAQPGSASVSNGTWSVAGSGSDIWGSADSFHFVSQALGFQNSATLTARVIAERNTNEFAKAGIMIRDSMDPDAASVILDVKPNGGVEFMTRASTRASTRFVGAAVVSLPVWFRLVYDTHVVTGQISTDGSNWTNIGTVPFAFSSPFAGLAVTSHDTSVLNQAMFDQVTTTTVSTLPPPCQHSDVGATGVAGSATYGQGQFVVKGAGADIWGTADAFHFVYRPLQGDGQIIARTQGLEDIAGPFAKAGVMIRETLDSGSKHVLIDLKPDGGIEFMSRQTTGGSTTFFGGRTQHPPTWLKLIRHGGMITGSVSADSARWFDLGDVSISMANTVYVGLAVTSHDSSTLISSGFDNVLMNWNTQEVGSPIAAGSVAEENGAFIVNASGDDIWGAVDNFHFVSVPVANLDNEVVAVRIDSLQNTSTFAKAGIMIRDSMDSTSAHVIIDVKPDGGVEFIRREQTSGGSEFIAGGTTSFPAYLSLAISGGSVSGFICDASRQCTPVGTTTAWLSRTSSIGLAVVSHNPGVLTTAVFGSVAVSVAR